ncbi:rab-family small gtpase 33 [Chrysochromulina tobinii]|uniref:Rab-family small gtpase 33 n=1 Tax=Chrysochromulina tobinii TaxID=1460289 RepID=A0A0M0JPJ6_9EUKA|nr:rab-family small gtpase 33 [Chrysochromulina tobinii]|eukprot:KOO28501.1 rab-family small gtpase 33 [Chrysochromulina sp. CCMP291]
MVATLMTPASQDYHFSFSLIVLGDQRVGKSQLIACTLPEEAASETAELVEASSPELPRVLVGNKSDGETQVTAEEAVALAQKHGCKYFETSAIRNEQVPEAFSSLIARVVAQIPNPPEPSLLLRKRIQIGKALADNKSFRAALFDYSPKV